MCAARGANDRADLRARGRCSRLASRCPKVAMAPVAAIEERSAGELTAGEIELAQLGVAQLGGLGGDLGVGAVESVAGVGDLTCGGEDLGAPAVDVLGAVGASAFEAGDGIVDACDGLVVAAEARQGQALEGEAID